MTYALSQLSDATLLRALAALVIRDRVATVELLACMGEVDARRLYLPSGYRSMFAYCVEKLRLSEDSAYKRIRAARAARRFPGILRLVGEGGLNLSGVVLLAPYLTTGNASELLGGAAGLRKFAIEELIAQRFPESEALPLVEALPSSPSTEEPAPGSVGRTTREQMTDQLAPGPVGSQISSVQRECRTEEQPSPTPVAAPPPAAPTPAPLPSLTVSPSGLRVVPIAARRFALHLTMGQSTHDKLHHAQALLSHQIPNGDLAGVLERVLDLAIGQLEKSKFAVTSRPLQHPRESSHPRTIPAHVRRAVWQRDEGQCTFVSESGHRCSARRFLEFDHVDPVARGGEATVDGIRLRCRAHNQYTAERSFGAEFMRHKREGLRPGAS